MEIEKYPCLSSQFLTMNNSCITMNTFIRLIFHEVARLWSLLISRVLLRYVLWCLVEQATRKYISHWQAFIMRRKVNYKLNDVKWIIS